jgi:hypothetical protein
MIMDTKNYIKSCDSCQFRKSPSTPKHSFAGSIPIGESVFTTISIDLVGKLPHTVKGNEYIVTLTDQVSKFAIVIPIKRSDDQTVLEVIDKEVFSKFGPPLILISDNGKNLCSNKLKEFYKSWGVKHIMTSPYHPQSNGQTERFNGTLGNALAQLVTEDHPENWDEYVHQVTYSYNSTVNEVTKFTPFDLLMGRNPDLPIARILGQSQDLSEEKTIEDKRFSAKCNIQRYQQKNRYLANKKRV